MFIPHQYDLGFYPGNKKKKLPPAITFTIRASDFEAVVQRMRQYVDRFYDHTSRYLHDLDTHFTLPYRDLFGRETCGFGSCARIEHKDGDVTFFVEIGKKERIYFATLTIHALSICLQYGDETPSNHEQQLNLSIRTDRQAPGWGHMLGGHIAMSTVRWIANYAKEHAVYDAYWSTPMHPVVVQAMHTTWKAMSERKMKRWYRDAGGQMSQEGRFVLICFGNACDIAIYPDIPMHEDMEYVQFSCHNLDSADQQLSLLAGLAMLLTLARESEPQTTLI